MALIDRGHESPAVERLAAAIAGAFDTHPPEFEVDRKVHLLNGDEARVIGRYLNGYGTWEYMVRHSDGNVWRETDGHLFQAWVRWTEPKMRAPKPESEAVRGALDVLIAQEGDVPESEAMSPPLAIYSRAG